jgi:glycine cleavage system H protein
MAHEPFCGEIPDGLLYDSRHDMWLRREGKDIVIGATSFGIHLAGEIIGFTAKPRGAEVMLGRGLGTVESAKTVLALHAPVSFVLTEANETAEEHPALLNLEPYGRGWMVRGRPLDWSGEWTGLVDAAAYRRHVLAIEPQAELR